MKYLIITIILLLFLPWNIIHVVAQESKIEIKKPVIFLSRDTLWTKDTLGCLDYRIKQASIIEDNKEQLIGKSESEIKDIFGEPNYYTFNGEKTIFVYYLGVTPDCEYIYSKNISRNDIEATVTFRFHFSKEGKFTSITRYFH